MRTHTRLLALALVASATTTAHAGGYDTPMLYTARHMGMGGAAVAYVDDPSAMFHNPAGLAGTERLSLVADFSLLTGFIEASPGNPAAFDTAGQSIESERTVAPFFLLGLSGRITDWLTAGFAVYPVASAGAEYQFEDAFGEVTTDRTTLVFIEMSPGVTFQIPSYPKLSIGFGWRITLVQLERFQETVDPSNPDFANTQIDFDISGSSFAGFRFGIQWRAYDWLQLGLSYRHETETTVSGSGTVVATEFDYIDTTFTLPSRLIFGVRSDIGDFGAAADVEIGFNSQNVRNDIFIGDSKADARREDNPPLPNVSNWDDAVTLRLGVEYRLLDGRLPIRLGYVWDQRTSDPRYPSAFGTPPGPTNVVTSGIGWQAENWSVDLAYAYRWGNANVSQEDINSRPGDDTPPGTCDFCGYAGVPNDGDNYSLKLHGIYVTFAWELGRRDDDDDEEPTTEPAPETAPEPEPEPEPLQPVVDQAPAPAVDTSVGEPVEEPTEEPAEEPATEEPAASEAAGTEPL